MQNKALFLDRDGVINVNKGYVHKPEDVEWVDGIFDVLKRFQHADFKLIVVTNQSGIARGMYSIEQFHALSSWMTQCLAKQGIVLNDVFFCPHHSELGQGKWLQQCDCRKPEPGMLLAAQQKWQLDMSQSVMIGDSWSDVIAAERAGVNNIWFYADSINTEQQAHAMTSPHTIRQVRELNAIHV